MRNTACHCGLDMVEPCPDRVGREQIGLIAGFVEMEHLVRSRRQVQNFERIAAQRKAAVGQAKIVRPKGG